MPAPDGSQATPGLLGVHSLGEYARTVAAVAVVAGFVLVGLTQMGLDWFYGHFGLSSQDVGLNQTSILFETAATGIAALAAAAVIGVGVALAVHRLLRSRRPTRPPPLLAQPAVVCTAIGVALVLLAAFLISGVVNANRSLSDTRAGRSVPSQALAHGEVVARCTEVWWKDPYLDGLIGRPQGTRLVYLGEAAGVTSFYDATTTRTIRIPTEDIATRSC